MKVRLELVLDSDIDEGRRVGTNAEIANEADVQDLAIKLMNTLYWEALGYSADEISELEFFR